MRLIYKGDGDYDLEVGIVGAAVIELSYDGDEWKEGAWTFWNVRVGDDRIGGTQLLGPSPFRDWLESEARKLPHLQAPTSEATP